MGIEEEIGIKQFKSPYSKSVINIIYTGHWYLTQINHILKPYDLSEPQYNVLSTLYSRRGVPMSTGEILNHMVQKESNVTRIVDRLVKKGWVSRKQDEANRSKVALEITESGREIFRQASRSLKEFHKPLAGKLDKEEFENLSAILDKLRNRGDSHVKKN